MNQSHTLMLKFNGCSCFNIIQAAVSICATRGK